MTLILPPLSIPVIWSDRDCNNSIDIEELIDVDKADVIPVPVYRYSTQDDVFSVYLMDGGRVLPM